MNPQSNPPPDGRLDKPGQRVPDDNPVNNPDTFLRPTWAEISLSKLKANLARVRRLAGSDRQVMAVVKADAYGHGAVPVARALEEAGVDWFGVATVEEALELRHKGIRRPILLLGGLYLSDPAHLVEYDLVPTVSSTARLDTYAECARRLGKPIGFHLKMDTGMRRLGMPPELWQAFLEHYRQLKGIVLKGVLTHLASAEDPEGAQTREQLLRFSKLLRALKSSGVKPEWVHVSNSAGLMAGLANELELRENMVRIGALLYGFCPPFTSDPHQGPNPGGEFEPVLELKSRLMFLKDVPAGAPLGYGGTFRTRRPSRIATVPIGYADGLSRKLSNRGRAIVRDHYAPIVGNISMDLTLLDLTDVPGAEVGDVAVFIGASPHCALRAREMADELETLPYEVLCSIGKRVPRVYL